LSKIRYYPITIKIENKPVFYEDWFRKGICFVNDIMSEDGKFLSIDQLEEKFNIIFSSPFTLQNGLNKRRNKWGK
jgi:hypothetical protein